MYKENQTGIITFGDKTTSKVIISKIITCSSSGMPNDIVFKYQDNETHRPLTNPVLVKLGHEEGTFNLPEGLADMVFKAD
jgi:hypothetical protein